MLCQSGLHMCQVTCLFSCSEMLSLISKVILPFLAYIWHRCLPSWIFTRILGRHHRHCHHHSIWNRISVSGLLPILLFLDLAWPHWGTRYYLILLARSCEENTEQVQNQPPLMSFSFPWKNLAEVLWTRFKEHSRFTSLLLSISSQMFEMFPLSQLIRGCWLLWICPSPSTIYLFSVKPFIFEESLSSNADVFRNGMT